MDFLKFLIEKELILIPVLYILGMFIKNTPRVKDWIIPWVLLVIGITLGMPIGISAGLPPIEAGIQGVLVAGATVFTNQLIKQTGNRK